VTLGNRVANHPGSQSPDLRGPRLASHLVLRPRLLDELNVRSPLTLLRAPLGFGKTALLAQWYRCHRQESAVWVTVTSDATDAPGFWQAILDALVDAGQAPLATTIRASTRAQVARAIAGTGHPLTLVVDGFDRVSADGVDGDLLDLLRTSPNLRLIVSLRGRTHFRPYQHLDLDATVIPPSGLRFTPGETAALLDQVSKDISDEQVQFIHGETGGWVELTLAFAVAIRDRIDSRDRTRLDSRAATRVARDYVRQRILPAIGGHDQVRFILSTSVVDEVSADIAQALVDGGSADSHLERLEASGGLSANAEHGELVYRWPPAVRRALAEELHRAAPERARHLHRQIARWHLEQKQPELTLDHAVRARDWQLVLLTVEHHWEALLLGQPHHLFTALAAMPLEVAANRPRAIAMHALRFQTPDQALLDAVPSLPAGTGELARLGANPEAAEILDTGQALLIALRRRGLFPQALSYSRQLEAIADTARHTSRSRHVAASLPCLFVQFALVHLLADDLLGGLDLLKVAFDLGKDSSFDYMRRETVSNLALTLAFEGETKQATVWLDRYREMPSERTWLRRYVTQTATTAEALLALDRLDIDSAAAALDAAVGEEEVDEFLAFTTYVRALLALHRGNPELGLQQLEQFRAAHPAWQGDGSTARPLLASVEVELLVAANRGNQARATLNAAGQDHPLLRGAAARLALLGGNAKAALDLATDTASARPANRRLQIEMLVVRAVAQHRLGNASSATKTLGRALSAAATTGSLRPFSAVPRAELMEIVEQLPARSAELLHAPPLASGPDLFPGHVGLIDLTDRERLVLEQLAQGLPLRNIAKNLYVSVNTVKTQCRSLYQKLEASSRRQAVARARESGLLEDPPRDAA
jgi:LuxR family transcriptional regulator, maltose regulon positive regulatory protein